MKIQYTPIAALAAALLIPLTPHASADVITDWNKHTVDATKSGGQNSNLGTRIGAIEAIAVYDAVNSIRRFGTPYHFHVAPADPASAEAAAAQAAHDVLTNYFPAQAAALDAKLAASLGGIPDGPDKAAGQVVGSASAAAIIALRANDGASPNVTYPGPVNPGVGEWRPTPGAVPGSFPPGINQQWGAVRPFLLPSPDVFRPAPPPDSLSADFHEALTEVEAIGSVSNTVRTPEQTHIAQFYRLDSEILVNEAARLLSAEYNLSLEENARLFLLIDIAQADVRIAIWDAKYAYNFWRPVTALNADDDGEVRNGYAAWTPLLVTPSHPSYPSGHSGIVSAGFRVLKAFFGNKNTLTLHTTTPGEPPRTIRHLSQVEQENGLSRIYGGIHYSFDNEAGQYVGRKVAAYVLEKGPHILRRRP